MSGKPGGTAAEFGQFSGGIRRFVVLDAGFAGLALFAVVESENEVVGWIIESDEAQMRLEGEARTGVEGGNLIEGERRAFGAVEGFNKGPLDAGNVEGETMAAAGELRVGSRATRGASSRGCAA